jgi:hypothetical protein
LARAFRTPLASPTIFTAVGTFLPSSAGSMSTWMIWAWGAKALRRPVTRSSMRIPTARMVSQLEMAMLQ